MRLTITKPIFLFLLLFCIPFLGFSQRGELKGIVVDKTTGEPIIAASVYVKNENRGVNTDFDGFYTIGQIAPGEITVICRYIGYDTLVAKVIIESGKSTAFNFYLTEQVRTLEAAEVKGQKEDKSKETSASKHTISPRDMQKLPTLGGAPDLAQYLQVLPGVVFTGDQGGQLYIRGGSPVMNKILLDGMTIYNPFHSIGLFSVFDADLIKTADVYSAGFGAEYGGRISAVVDVKTRDGNRVRHAGNVNVGPFMSKLLIEGPLKKYKAGSGSSSYALSVKNSYLERTSKLFYEYADPSRLPYSFNDIYGKIAFNSPNGTSFKVFGFRFDDRVNFPQSTSYSWLSNGFGTRFVFIPDESKTKIDGFLAYSDYRINQQEQDNRPRQSAINGFNMGLNFSYFLKKDELRYGVEINGFRTEFEIFNANNRRIEQNDNTTEIGGFFLYRYIRNRLIFDAGFRSQFYASLGNSTFEPRFSGKYNFTKKVRAKFASGMYSQNLLSSFSDRDVVNLFYGFLSGPDNLPKTFNGNPVTHRLQKSWHAVAGVEYDLNDNMNVNLEGFYKKFTQLSNINRDKLYDDNELYANKPERERLDYIIENGDAYGADISYKYTDKKVYFWAVYSLTFVNRFDGLITYPTHWDRRHNVNTLVSYTPDKKKFWNLSLRWNFGSGFPFTQTQGFYEKLDFQGTGIGTDYTGQNGTLGVFYGDLNGGRLPYYHRLDFSVDKTIKETKTSKIWAVFSLTNVYNRNNIFYFDRATFTRVDQLPIMPALSLNAKF